MATDVNPTPVNGNYASHQGYGTLEQQHQLNNSAYGPNAAATQTVYAQATPASSSSPAPTGPAQQEIPKDEVGWFFVEQYYTTLSRSPEKLYLFYQKRSQFVSGQETDKVAVCVGQRAINDRIKELDFQDCKVRVTNVDSQASDSNIVIQVIGEISNKSQPHKKFTQTFVLATQTNGYFVLNDIFRYIIEEEDEPEAEVAAAEEVLEPVPTTTTGVQEPAHSPEDTKPKTLTSSAEPQAVEHDAQQVDKEVEEKVLHEQAGEEGAVAAINGGTEDDDSDVGQAEEAPAAVTAEPVQEVKPESDQAEAVEDLKPEKPVEPKPTPQPAASPKQAPPSSAAASKPVVPKTWATLAAAANRSAGPAQSATSSSATSAASAPRPTPPATKTATPSAAAPASAPTAPAAQRDQSPAANSQDEWTAVGGGHNRQQSRQANGPQQDQPQWRGYIKNVHEGVDEDELKKALEKYGELLYFDIARQKNCAFVDFKTKEGYESAMSSGPHIISNERLYVEERRFKPGATPYIPRGQYQGSRGRGSGNQGAPRGGYQSRGGFTPRGNARGGAAARGRGGAQAA